jgi:hypothetical protein
MKEQVKNTPYVSYDEVGLEKISVTYTQDADTNDSDVNVQSITFETVDVPCGEDEYPYYFNMRLNSDHWSFNDINELKTLFDDFLKRLHINDKA